MDTDGDGWDDAYDPTNGGTPIALADTDADGYPDYLDTDSDGDGIIDLAEGVIGEGESLVIPTLSGLDADEDGLDDIFVITSYSIHYTKLYEEQQAPQAMIAAV